LPTPCCGAKPFSMTHEIKVPPRQIGFWTCLALVVGNTIGTGIFLLPATLAPFGWNALYGWLITIGGSLCLAYVFASLARAIADAGGPYDFIAAALGPIPAFFVVWSYWISLWVSVAAIAIGAISYLSPFAPALFARPAIGPISAMALVVIMTAIAIRGVRASGTVQIVTTILKIAPLIAVFVTLMIVVGGRTDTVATTANVAPIPVGPSAIAGAAALALWAMLGFEAGTVPAGRIVDPQRTIARATIIGTLFVGVVYVLTTIAVFLLLPSNMAASSTAPLADMIGHIWGQGAGKLIAAFAAVSAIGALNGWVFLQAEVPLVLSERGVFPRIFSRVNDAQMPVYGHLIGCTLSVVLIAMNLSSGLIGIYSFIVLLATVATLVLYLFGAIALLTLSRQGRSPGGLAVAAAIIGVGFSIWALYGAGVEATGWGAVLLATGIPVYFVMRLRAGSSRAAEAS